MAPPLIGLAVSAVGLGLGLAGTAFAVREAEVRLSADRRAERIRRGVAIAAGLAGMVAGLVAWRRRSDSAAGSGTAVDAALHGRIRHELALRGIPIGRFAIEVDDGIVTVRGAPESTDQESSLRATLEELPGVRLVQTELLEPAGV
jgi:hypothetical protein